MMSRQIKEKREVCVSCDLPAVSVVRGLAGRQQLGQAEVGDLDVVRTFHQDVPRSQVSMHQVALLQVAHPLHTHTRFYAELVTLLFVIFPAL